MGTRLIVGLGNPGPRYAHTRHNVGFMVLSALQARWAAAPLRARAQVALWRSHQPDAMLAAPQAFMNLSGEGLGAVLHFYRLSSANLLVVHDELDFEAGRIRLKAGGGHGGHNGLRSIIAHLGAQFDRLRVGIGRPLHGTQQAADYVLARPDAAAAMVLRQAVVQAADAVQLWVDKGMAIATAQLHAP